MYIHTSNLLVTGLNTEDKWRIARLEGKKPSEKTETEKIVKKEVVSEKTEKTPNKVATKETKVTKTQKKEVEK